MDYLCSNGYLKGVEKEKGQGRLLGRDEISAAS